jgi:hypothetical protein
MIQSRDELKHAFRSGAIPTAIDFANLIDSLAHVDEVAPLSKRIDQLGAGIDAVSEEIHMPATLSLEADGAWKVLKSGVATILAFEILAHIEKTKASPYSAVTHAVAVIGAAHSRPSVRQTKSFSQGRWPLILPGLVVVAAIGALVVARRLLVRTGDNLLAVRLPDFSGVTLVAAAVTLVSLAGIAIGLVLRDRRAITVRWRSNGWWFDPNRSFDLVIRSGCDYGSKTQKVPMTCQISRLWS